MPMGTVSEWPSRDGLWAAVVPSGSCLLGKAEEALKMRMLTKYNNSIVLCRPGKNNIQVKCNMELDSDFTLTKDSFKHEVSFGG